MCLKSGDRDGVGKIDTAHIFVRFNPQQRIGVLLGDLSGQSGSLATKDQRVAWPIVGSQVILGCKTGEQPKSLGRNLLAQIFPVFHSLPRQVLPVIQPRSPERLFRDLKTQRLHQPKLRLKCDASPSNGPRIGWYLWLMQNDMDSRFVTHGLTVLQCFW